MKKEKDIKVTKKKYKNYILLVLLFAAAIALTLYLCKWYNVYDEYQKQTPVIRDTLFELTTEELDHYIVDNPTAAVYMCTASELKCRSFEKDFKKLINNQNLKDKIVYLNLSDLNVDEFMNTFNNTYPNKKKLENYPAIIVFEDGEITHILQGNEKEPLKIGKVKQFIEMNKVGE